MAANPDFDDPITLWPQPDLGVLRNNRREPPVFPIEVCEREWSAWILQAAKAAACPVDYVMAPLIASVSALIGNARWAQATPGWAEPPHLWICDVGDSGDGKSPGSDGIMRHVLPEIERRMLRDFPDQLREWRTTCELSKAAEEKWKSDVRDAHKAGRAPPAPPSAMDCQEPQAPRLRQYDVTVERVASLLGTAAPKGLLICRDELVGWIDGMTAYNAAGRSFWVESYGGRPFRVERQKHPEPFVIPRFSVAVFGGTQPDKLALLMREADDGLLARMLWVWPSPIPFLLGRAPPGVDWAITALDRLRELSLQPGDPPQPIMVRLDDPAIPLIEAFGQKMQLQQKAAGGLLRSAYGKARGHALRLALNLEYLWWCGMDGMAPPPARISEKAFIAAACLVEEFFIPMAERVYGDAALPEADRLATIVARWILDKRLPEKKSAILNARALRRQSGLPGLRHAEKVKLALDALVDADWLMPAPVRSGGGSGRKRDDYIINPRLKGVSNAG